MKKLYVRKDCPYCQKVMQFVEQNKIDVEYKDIQVPANKAELYAKGGKVQVPFLEDGKTTMYESMDIIKHLSQ